MQDPLAGPPGDAASRADAAIRTLHELTRTVSASLDSRRVAADVTGLVRRLLHAGGAALLLVSEDQEGLVVAAAEGTLAGRVGSRVDPASAGLALEAMAHEELRQAVAEPPGTVPVFEGLSAACACAAPLLAHGVTTGVLVVVDREGCAFAPEDGRLLAAASTHTAIALTNARFFELVERGKRQWEATFDALSEGIALADADGRLLRVNTSFAQLAGDVLPALVGRDIGETLFGDRLTMRELLATARRGERPAPLVRRSERLRVVLRVVAAPIPPEADVGAVVVAVEDVSEQQAIEAQAIQSEKMAAVGTLVSGVAHELNNPLTSIAGLAEFLLEQPEGTVPDRDHVRVIAEEAQRAGNIVRNLLTFARKGPAERQRLDLADVVDRTLSLMDWELRLQGIAVERRTAAGLPAVLGDRQQLQQVVLNLVTNASQALVAMPAGLPKRITVAVEGSGEQILVRVSDTGLGIPADVLPQVFSPFFTTKPHGEGTGLGLFISYGLVEGHGGSLTAESRPGAGATFTMALPRAPEPDVAAAAPPAAPPAPAAARRILVLDDDAGVRRMVAALFAREGHTVDAAADGDAALRLATVADYDLLIADRRAAAEGTPFLEALERVRPGWAGRVIVSTADVPRPSGATGSPPATRTLRKPFNLRDLRAAADAVWGAAGPS